MAAVETAVRLAGPELGAVRIDSGDLPVVVQAVRDRLDELGATSTRITVTNDLDEYAIAGLAASPVDSYGAGHAPGRRLGPPDGGLRLQARGARRRGRLDAPRREEVDREGGQRRPEVGVPAARGRRRGGGADRRRRHGAAGRRLPRPRRAARRRGPHRSPRTSGVAGVRAAREHHARVIAELPSRSRSASPAATPRSRPSSSDPSPIRSSRPTRRVSEPSTRRVAEFLRIRGGSADPRGAATSGGRRSSCSRGRSGTSPGRAPAPRPCRRARGPACR